MVITFEAQLADTPAGNPLAPGTPLFDMPVAPVVLIVIFVNRVLMQSVGFDEGGFAVLFAIPVPVNVAVGELLPEVVLDTVIVALCKPLLDGVKVTWNVALPFAGIVVDDKLLTTNCALLETTEIPLAAAPVLFIVYV